MSKINLKKLVIENRELVFGLIDKLVEIEATVADSESVLLLLLGMSRGLRDTSPGISGADLDIVNQGYEIAQSELI